MSQVCDYKSFTAVQVEDGLVHITFKKVKKLTRNDVLDIFDCYKKCKARSLYVLITFSGFIPMSDEAMTEGKRLEKYGQVKATAYVFKNAAMRLGFKFFYSFYKPKRPVAVFKSKEEGKKWLKKMQGK